MLDHTTLRSQGFPGGEGYESKWRQDFYTPRFDTLYNMVNYMN